MADFIHGLHLNELFYGEVVAPLLKAHVPDVPYSATLIGWGSEVLGYDDVQSTDHNWGLRLQLFVSEDDDERHRTSLASALSEHLPPAFRGYPSAYPLVVNDDQRPSTDAASPRHNIAIETVNEFFERYLGYDPSHDVTAADWLTFPEHKLLAVTSGKVFHDGLGALAPIRRKFSYYPQDVWLYMLAAQWVKIFEEQAFVGRCGDVGDEVGSMLIAARQVKHLMRLCFLMERTYAPYSKWFGTAFAELDCAEAFVPLFEAVLHAREWQERQAALAKAYEVVAAIHNNLKLTIPLVQEAARYFGRPYLVVGDERYPEELRKVITSEAVKHITHDLGSVNQCIDSHAQLNDPRLCKRLKHLYT